MPTNIQETKPSPAKLKYEKPTITRHAVLMTMAPAGSKMGHGVFPFTSKRPKKTPNQCIAGVKIA